MGATAALAGGIAGYLVTILMYLAKHFGIDDMTMEVATAFVSIAIAIAGGVSHFIEGKKQTS
jgi:hypothetical protein